MATFHKNNTCVLSHHDDNHKTTTNNNNNHHHCVGSGFTKQQRSDDHQHFQPNKSMSLRSHSLLSLSPSPSPSPSPADANNMLSFSTSSSSSSTNTPKDGLFSFYQPSHSYIRNTGYGYGYGGPVSRYNKGPFTPSQWMELEHQALIYKHFVANVPVPSNLLNPIRKSLNTFLFPGSSSSTSYSPGSFGWGTFHLGFAGPADPEPGRCRRTDGKKWRCSRDAVPDQKYCERHINRGRHRSRKPVESQNGQAVSGPTASKAGPVISASSVPVSTALSTAKGATLHRDNHNPHAIASSPQTPINRTQEPQAFGINSSSVYPTNYGSFLDHGAYASNPNPLPGFVDEWSKDEPLKPDWTQLSMSIPMASSDFSSSSNSPAQEKQASNWIPISWGNSSSMGGPLGEVLNRTCSSGGLKSKNPSSGSEEMSEMWDAIGYHMGLGSGSSPTGVLQKTTFVSLSNSSSGSSPKKDEHGDRLLLSTLASIT